MSSEDRARRLRPRRPRALAVAGAVLVTASLVAGVVACAPRPSVPGPDTADFENAVRIPEIADSHMEDGTRVFDLTAQEARAEIVDAGETPTLAYNGDYLGPTLVAERGERVRVDVHNELDEPTTVHWHGMHVPAAMDGGPHQPIAPGASWSPEWEIDQPAATLWYHPHLHEKTREQVDAGLAGMFLLRDEEEEALALPRDYGVDDIPVIVQDRTFQDDGEFGGQLGPFEGVLGDTILVNGTAHPYLDVTTERVRLRILNGSSARMYDFGLDDGRPMDLIATDGGLLEAPVSVTSLPLSPGERAEIVVTLTPGEIVRLRSEAPDPELNAGSDDFDVMELRAASSLDASPAVPASLVDVPKPDATDIAATRSFEMSGFNINNQQMEMDRIDLVATVDTNEIWEVRNTNPLPHSFHVHDTQFRILTIDGTPPPPELAGYKDTIALERNREYRLLVRFEDYADPETPYMYHCHLLWHEDQGMMGQFLVVEPGQAPALTVPEGEDDGHHH